MSNHFDDIPETPTNNNAFPCQLCAGQHWGIDCPQWVKVPTNLADAKAMFASNGLSLSTTRDHQSDRKKP